MKTNVDSEIMLSVIIPTCNRNNTLPRAIYSVLSQNVTGLEVIVVNDTDTPVSNEILNIAKSYPLTFATNPGKHGAAGTRNYGVSIAKGKYITFLDDDDIYLPGRLNNMLKVVQSGNYVIVSSGRIIEYDDFKRISIPKHQLFGEVGFKDVLFGNDIDIGFMISRDTFCSLGGFDTNLNSLEDWDFILRALSDRKGYKIQRFDYVVNRTAGFTRVSARESEGYIELSKKWRDSTSLSWLSFMISTSLRLSKKLTLISALKLSLKFASLIPLKQYLSVKVKND
ncbi:glycosyltransferase family 2 protein [Aeromonas sp. R7-1]|uniref:glycosyltransferase family 2 protein n=1 Tax=Aeromonas sp. R7-1 TaxID=3138473 RepID=UPI0034A4D039